MNIYPIPSSLKLENGRFSLKAGLQMYADTIAQNAAALLCKRLEKQYDVSVCIVDNKNCDILFLEETMEKENYRLQVLKNKIMVYAADYKGFVHAVETFMQMVSEDLSVQCVTINDAPYKQYRGIHIEMPAPEYIEECKRLFDVLSFLKYNTVILEVGGAMELKKHPEINEAWAAFSKMLVKDFPGGPQNFQACDKYWKDATHFENARGKILSQEMVHDLVQYAKNLGLNVIPEIQALCHCYYLTIAHREIAEDQNDLFPDSYCPMNEESYKLYFEVAQEMIDVIEPEIVSIGHDEIRILGECPRCKDKSGHELLAYEINRLYDFYTERNIRVMMWSESMLEPGPKYGMKKGEEINRVDAYGRHYRLPAMYKAINDIPKDILMLDWYHAKSHNTQKCFTDHGFETMFGNFKGLNLANWDIREKDVIGAEISTWSTPDEFALARNGVMFDLIFSAQLLWNEGYDDSKFREYLTNATKEVERVRRIMCGKQALRGTQFTEILFCGKDGLYDVSAENAVCYGSNAAAILEKCPNMSGVPIDTAHVMLRTDFYADSLLFCEGFKKREDHYMSYSFYAVPHWEDSPTSDSSYLCCNRPRWSIATHEILYEDGSWELVNAVYGITGARVQMNYGREQMYLDEKINEIDDAPDKEDRRKLSPHYKLVDQWMTSALYFNDTIVSGENTAFVHEWQNPHPEKKIVCIKCVSTTHDIEQSAVLFALGYKKKSGN